MVERLPHELQCVIVAGVDRPGNLRAASRGLQGVVDDCTTSLSFGRDVDDASAPSTQAVLGLVQRTPLLTLLRILHWWPEVQWATVLAACPRLQTLTLMSCYAMADLSFMAACTGLHTLILRRCPLMADLSVLAAWGGVTWFHCSSSDRLPIKKLHKCRNAFRRGGVYQK